MNFICEPSMCAGCMACVDVCTRHAVTIEPAIDFYEPHIDQDKCVDCGRCKIVCQQLSPVEGHEPVEWLQGWDSDRASRLSSSSGGVASAVMRGFVQEGGVVCACCFSSGEFKFEFAEAVEDLFRFKGSKYVKSNPTGVYKEIINFLKKDIEVLFVGLPCQVSAVRKIVPPGLKKGLYTIDLICHGSPSPRVLEAFLEEKGAFLSDLQSIDFRSKGRFGLREQESTFDLPGVVDAYSIAFLSGLSYTENCYSCAYANLRRVGDLTLGDSWGSELSPEIPDGISLALCQNEKGKRLLNLSCVTLKDVDAAKAVANNAQLVTPSIMPRSRRRFIEDLENGTVFSVAVRRCLPRAYFRQSLKRLLIKLRLL